VQVEVSAVRVLFELLGFLLSELSALSFQQDQNRFHARLASDLFPVHLVSWPDRFAGFRLQLGRVGNHNLGDDYATQG